MQPNTVNNNRQTSRGNFQRRTRVRLHTPHRQTVEFTHTLTIQSPHSRLHRPLQQHFSRPWIFGWLLLILGIQIFSFSVAAGFSDFTGIFFKQWLHTEPRNILTLTLKHVLDSLKVNRHAKYLHRTSFMQNLLSGHTHTHRSDRLLTLVHHKVVGINVKLKASRFNVTIGSFIFFE